MRTPRSSILAVMVVSALSACTTLTPKPDAVAQAAPSAADAKPASVSSQAPVAPVPVAAPAPAAAPMSREASRLQQLIQQHAVTELRAVHNGNYGASLLLDAQSLQYYASLSDGKDLWKVRSTANQRLANQWFAQYARQSKSLAATDINRIRLQADYARTEADLRNRAAELTALQSDLDVQREQAQQVLARQATARAEAAQLAKQQAHAQKQLRALESSIRKLEAQQAKLR